MCGICGKVTFDGSVPEADLIDTMCRTLIHRGPDDQGIHTAEHIGLGQRRLSIIDLSHEATAPLANEDRTVWVVLNGEIYNFREVRAELVEKGHVFRTAGDTEVILHLYEEYGLECLSRMRGMFAFALWDSARKRLFAARDRLGQKPLCYARTGGSLVFGSEIKAITADPSVSVSPDYRAIDLYLRYQYVPSPLTAFEGVAKLPPGHFLTCQADGTVEVRRYWRPPLVPKSTAPAEELEAELLARLRESVKMRLVSDVPLGAFLSGGIDSGTVVALMASESTSPVKTFSIGFEDEAHNELPGARLTAERYGTEHREFIVKPQAADVLGLLVRHYNEPFADSSALPTYYVSKMTRQGVTVALSGDGGDESFCGYAHYARTLQWGRADAVPALLRHAALAPLEAVLGLLPFNHVTGRSLRACRMLRSRWPQRYVSQVSIFKDEERRACYTRRFRSLLAGSGRGHDRPGGFPWAAQTDPADWMMCHDQNFYLPDCLMVKSDIASMANSLEVRSPFLDHRLVEFAATIPRAMKRDAAGGKAILKRTVRDIVPAQTIHKPKTGFSVPLARWLRDDLAEMVRGSLLDDRFARRGLIEPAFVRRMIGALSAGRNKWASRLWALLMLELWFREFID